MNIGDYRDNNEYTLIDFIRDNIDKSNDFIRESWGMDVSNSYIEKCRQKLAGLKDVVDGIREDVNALSDDELAEKYGITPNKVRTIRSKYGINRTDRLYFHLCIDCDNATDMRKCSWVMGIVINIDTAKFPDGCLVNKRGIMYSCPYYKESRK